MKKKQSRLPVELHDTELPSLNWSAPIDVSDHMQNSHAENVLPQRTPQDEDAQLNTML